MNGLHTYSAVDLFNLPLTEFSRPIIDCRTTLASNANEAIPTSLLFREFESMDSLLAHIDSLGFENCMSVILYGANSRVDRDEEVMKITQEFISRNRQVSLLLGGYEAFINQFPLVPSLSNRIDKIFLPAYIPLLNIYLGGEASVTPDVIAHLRISTIVNCGAKFTSFPDVTYLYLPLVDDSKQELEPHLSEALQFLQEQYIIASEKGTAVLIHCEQGKSRSTAIAVARLVEVMGWDVDESLAYIKKCRKVQCICYFRVLRYVLLGCSAERRFYEAT